MYCNTESFDERFKKTMSAISEKQRNATFQLSLATTFILITIVLLETISLDILTQLASSYITPIISSIAAKVTAATGVSISAAILTQIIIITLILASLFLIRLAYTNITTDLHEGKETIMPPYDPTQYTNILDPNKSKHTKSIYISFIILAASIVFLTKATLATPYLIAIIEVAIISFVYLIYSFAGKTLLANERAHTCYMKDKNITTDSHEGKKAIMPPYDPTQYTNILDPNKSKHTKSIYISFIILAASIVFLTKATLATPYLIAIIEVAIISFVYLIYSFAGKTLLANERAHTCYMKDKNTTQSNDFDTPNTQDTPHTPLDTPHTTDPADPLSETNYPRSQP
jgi:predicted thioesterase